MRIAAVIVTLAMVACEGNASDFNAQGEKHAAAWAKSEDNTEFNMGIRAFRAAAGIEPNNALYHYNLGTMFAQARCYEDALPALERALALRPDWAEARNNVEYVREAIAANETDCTSNNDMMGIPK